MKRVVNVCLVLVVFLMSFFFFSASYFGNPNFEIEINESPEIIGYSLMASDSDLVAHYEFDDSADPGKDSSVTAEDGAVSGATWTASGQFGGALNFDGVDDIIIVNPNNAHSFDQNTDFTIATWFKSNIGGNQILFDKLGFSGALGLTAGYKCFLVIFRPTNSINCKLYGKNSTGGVENILGIGTGQVNIDNNTWYHFAYVVDRSGNAQTYLNGVAVGTPVDVTSIVDMTQNTMTLNIGGGRSGSTSFLSGTMDGFRIYDVALTSSEIFDLYNGSTGGGGPICTNGEIRPCSLTLGVCVDLNETCTGEIWPGCVYSGIAGYEVTESSCFDTLDNDCDGLTDINDSNCIVAFCGDGIVGGIEECDDNNTIETDLCYNNCTNIIYQCGNNIMDPGEVCDGTDIPAEFCDIASEYESGSLSCLNDCSDYDLSACYTCGNNITEGTEQCDDGNLDNNDLCDNSCQLVVSCSFTTAYWNTSTATEGDVVTLTVEGENCNDGEVVDFSVFENDLDFPFFEGDLDDPANINPLSVAFSSGIAITNWTVEWQCDGELFGVCWLGRPKYYFNAVLVSDSSVSIKSSDPELDVFEASETCGNGIIGAGETCDDGNVNSSDGCSSTCTIENGYSCSGAPSVCTTSSSGMIIDIITSRISGVAPLYVFFDASETTHTDGSLELLHQLDYKWDFNDPTSGVWATSGLPKNKASGYMGAHVFDTPGTYDVELIVKDPFGGIETKTVQITVTDPDTVYSGTNTICISVSGDFTGCPNGANEVTTNSFSEAISYLTDGKRVLLHRGETWTPSSSTNVGLTIGPATLGAYGTGSNPLISSSASSILNDDINSLKNLDLRVMDLEFVGSGVSDGQAMIRGLGGTLFYRLEISESALCFSSSKYTQVNPYFVNNGFIELNCHDNPPGAAYGMYWGGKYLAIMGSTFDNTGASAKGGHTIRIWHADHILIEHNDIKNCPRDCLKMHAEVYSVEEDWSKNILISNNKWEPGFGIPWAMAIGPKNTVSDQRVRDILWENDFITMISGGDDDYSILCWADNCVIRNNIFNMVGDGVRSAIILTKRGSEPDHTGARIYQNTCYSNHLTRDASCVVITSSHTDVIVAGNLLKTLDSTSVVVEGTATEISNIVTTNNQFVNSNPINPSDFVLDSSSIAIDAYGANPGFRTYEDFFGNVRPFNGLYDVGAIEYTGGSSIVCGDGIVNGSEVCEAGILGGATCVSRGFDSGTLGCSTSCLSYNTSLCVIAPNNPPILTSIGPKSVNEGVQLSFVITATDADSDSLTYSETGIPVGSSFDELTRTFTWTPSFSSSGTYFVNFSVTDGNGGMDFEIVTITVNNVIVIADADADGVPDASDKCPNTPALATVNPTNGCRPPLHTKFHANLTTDFSSVNDLLDMNNFSLGIWGKGRIEFIGRNMSMLRYDGTRHVPLNLDLIVIENNLIGINTLSNDYGGFDKPARLTLYNVVFSDPQILRDGVLCSECVLLGNASGVISFSVPGFSNYSIIETPVVVDDGDTGDDPGSSGGGSSGSSGGSPVISSIVNDIIINLDEVDKGSGEISLGELIYVIYNGATYSVEFDEQTNEAIRVIIGPDIGEYVILKDAVRIIDLDGVVGDDIAIAYTIVGDGVILYIEKIDGGVTPEHPSTVGEVIELEEEGDVKEDNGWIVWGILIGIVVIGIVLVIIRQNRKPQLVIGGVGHRQKLKNKKTVFEDKKVTRVGELS